MRPRPPARSSRAVIERARTSVEWKCVSFAAEPLSGPRSRAVWVQPELRSGALLPLSRQRRFQADTVTPESEGCEEAGLPRQAHFFFFRWTSL